jgi:ABC-2 type transport system permease protein
MYLFELKANRKFTFGWLATLIGITLIYMSFYTTFNVDIENFINLMKTLPETIRDLMGMDPNTIGSIMGYYTFIFTFILIAGSIEALILGLSILSKEIREKTADFLLSKPISRIKIVTSKILSSLTIILGTNIICFIGFYFILLIFADTSINFNTYTLITLVLLLMQLLFYTFGLLLSVIIPKIKNTLPIALGIIFGLYFLGNFTADNLRIFMPFKYFPLPNILLDIKYELKYLYITLSIIVISAGLTYLIYKKKDIPSV